MKQNTPLTASTTLLFYQRWKFLRWIEWMFHLKNKTSTKFDRIRISKNPLSKIRFNKILNFFFLIFIWNHLIRHFINSKYIASTNPLMTANNYSFSLIVITLATLWFCHFSLIFRSRIFRACQKFWQAILISSLYKTIPII